MTPKIDVRQLFYEPSTSWFGLIVAFVLKFPVTAVYFIVSLDEIVKLPAVYKHYKKYKWVKDLTVKE